MVVHAQNASPSPPPLGTFIDNGALELVEVLGYGGYGIVYRAIDAFSPNPASYAVKCLPHSSKRNATRQRQLHIREITLHQLASAHPGVVTLHRVVEDQNYTFIIMDYCGDGDLFSQILHNRRYLGHNELIKEVFLQLLDAVEYCHSLNIYHRDLKPENILCFDGGLRLAITDFGLATTDRMSTEFRTGSIYHMSPECQGGDFAPTKSYSPLFNDIWSLGIILLNLITGRNPWKSAAADDCTFQAYLKDPSRFLPTVLPISDEVNALLTRTLEVDWRRRITLREMRTAIKSIDSFYSPDVVFEDSMARCPWEAGVNMSSDSSAEEEAPEPAAVEDTPGEYEAASRWSGDSDSEMIFATQSAADNAGSASVSASCDTTCRVDSRTRSMSPSPTSQFGSHSFLDDLRTPSGPSTYSVLSSSPSLPSPPVTPDGGETLWSQPTTPVTKLLTLDTAGLHPGYYAGSITMLSARSSSMHTALESSQVEKGYAPYTSFFLESSSVSKASLTRDPSEGIGMIITPTDGGNDGMDTLSSYTYPTMDAYDSVLSLAPLSARPESPALGLDLGVSANTPFSNADTSKDTRANADWRILPSMRSPTAVSSDFPTSDYSFLAFSNHAPISPTVTASAPSFSFTSPTCSPGTVQTAFVNSFVTDAPISPLPLPIRPPQSDSSRTRSSGRKARRPSFLNPMRLAFPRRSRSRSSSPPALQTPPRTSPESYARDGSETCDSSPEAFKTHWILSTSISPVMDSYRCLTPTKTAAAIKLMEAHGHAQGVGARINRRRTRKKLRSARDWFSPGKLFAAVIPSL